MPKSQVIKEFRRDIRNFRGEPDGTAVAVVELKIYNNHRFYKYSSYREYTKQDGTVGRAFDWDDLSTRPKHDAERDAAKYVKTAREADWQARQLQAAQQPASTNP